MQDIEKKNVQFSIFGLFLYHFFNFFFLSFDFTLSILRLAEINKNFLGQYLTRITLCIAAGRKVEKNFFQVYAKKNLYIAIEVLHAVPCKL
jgi:hypothetical protein